MHLQQGCTDVWQGQPPCVARGRPGTGQAAEANEARSRKQSREQKVKQQIRQGPWGREQSSRSDREYRAVSSRPGREHRVGEKKAEQQIRLPKQLL